MKMHPCANLHPGANLLHLCRWCKFGGANKHPGAHLPWGANCAHERNLLSHMYNLSLDFLCEHVHVYENNYIYIVPLLNLRSWLLSVVTTSSSLPGCQAEQLEFLVYGLLFARFYISS